MKAQQILTESPSLTTFYLRLMFDDTCLATGTGFIYEYDEKFYMITNGHNVTGVNPETKQRLSNSHCGFPNKIQVKVKTLYKGESDTYEQNPKWFALNPVFATIDLYEDAESTSPLWLVHPKHAYSVDVIAVFVCNKVEMPNHLFVLPINNIPFDNNIPVVVSDDVFVLGYPYDINGGFELPIWKKGSIATEPSLDIDNLPKLLIDTATRPGMSGSPVIYQRSGFFKMSGSKETTGDDLIGTIRGFLGVYSGRIGARDKFDAQLGIVWKSDVIEEIIKGGIKGSCEFQYM